MHEKTFKRIRAQIGAYTLHSRYDGRAITANARAAFLRGFEKLVDPEGKLPEKERLRRASMARSAHFRRLALLSAKARAAKARRKDRGDQPDVPVGSNDMDERGVES